MFFFQSQQQLGDCELPARVLAARERRVCGERRQARLWPSDGGEKRAAARGSAEAARPEKRVGEHACHCLAVR